MPKHTLVILLAFATTLAAAPAAAFHEDEMALLVSTDLAGTGWVRYEIVSDGSKLALDLTADVASIPATSAILLSSPTTGAFMLTLVATEGGPELHASSDQLPEGISIDPLGDASSGTSGAGLTVEGWTGALSVVAWGAGGVSGVHAAARSDGGNTLSSASSGARTFMHTAEDFEGLNVGASANGAAPGVAVGSVSEVVGGTLVGQFFAIGETNLVGVTTQQASVTTPSGTTACGCFWMDPNAAANPGTWTFDVTYTSATFVSNVFLSGADLSG